MNDVDLLLQYLSQGDLLGFLVATFTTRIGQNFYAILTLMLSVPLYLRTQNVMYCVIAWLLLGGLFLVAMPIVSPVAVFLVALAITVTITKLFYNIRS